MSAQNAKKRRFGSRRMAPNQNETFKADKSHITDGTSVTQRHASEGSTESLNVLSNADNSKPETQHPPSPEVTMNRRKMGSSRRNKGRQHVEHSETEAYLEPSEEVEENTRGNTTPETTQMSPTTQLERQEEISRGSEQDMSASQKSPLYSATTPDYCSEVNNPTTTNCPEDVLEVLIPKTENLEAEQASERETKLEGIHKPGALQSEEIKENAHVTGISEVSSLLSCPSVDQQIINNQPTNARETPDEDVFSVAKIESSKRDDDTDLFRQDGCLQSSNLVSESHVQPVVLESITSEVTTDKSSPEESTELFSLAKEELPTSEEQSELFNLSEVRGAQHSEDVIDKVHEEDVKSTQMQDIHQHDYFPESLIIDATENADACSGNLTDHAEIRDTFQSELMVRSTDDSATKQEVSNPDDKQDEHATEERNADALDQTIEDYHVCESKQPWISYTDRVDTALGQMYEGEGQAEDNIKHNAGQTVHQDKEGVLSEAEKNNSALQTFQFDSQHQDDSVSVDEQTNTRFDPSGNRRKLGSSRRYKGRQHVKEPTEEVSDNTRDDEAPETAKMSSTTETLSQEELNQGIEHDIIPSVPHDSSMFSLSTPGHSSEVQSPSATNDPETDLESLTPKSENLQEDRAERETDFKVEVSDESVEATLEGFDKSDTLQSKEVRSALHSEDAAKKEPEDEVKPTQMQELLQTEYIAESVIDDATDNSVSNPDDKRDEHPTKQNNLEALDQRKEDYKKPWISDIERVDSAPEQVYEFEGRVEDDIKTNTEQTFHQEKEELSSEMDESKSSSQTAQSEANSPFDSQPQDNSMSMDNTGFHHSSNRRKLGSSRRNKGKQCVKDSVTESHHKPTEEVDGNTKGNEPSESTETLLSMETAGQENSTETTLEATDTFDTSQTEEENIDTLVCTSELTTVTAHSSPAADQQVIDQSRSRQTPDEQISSVCSVTEEISPGEHTDSEYRVDKAIDSSPTEELPAKDEQLSDVRGAQLSEDVKKVHEEEIEPAQIQEMSQVDHTSESVIDDATETGNLIDQLDIRDTHRPDLAVKSTDDPKKGNLCEASDQRHEDYHVYDTKKSQISDIERVSTALNGVNEIEGRVKDDIKPNAEKRGHEEGGLFSEMEESESALQSLQCEMNTPLDSQLEQNDTSFNPGGNRRKLGSSQEKLMETMLEGTDQSDTAQTDDVSVHVKQNAHFGTPAGFSEFTSSTPAADRQLIKSNSREMPDEGLLTVCSVTENKERDDDTELLRQDGNLHGNNLLSESHVKSENIETFMTPDMITEKIRPSEHTEDEQATLSPPKQELATNEEQHFNSSEVGGAWRSEDVVSTVHEEQINPAQMQEMHQIDYTSKSSLQTLPSVDSQPQDTSQSIRGDALTGFNPAVNRRKLGSSRRNKGRHHAQDTVTETYRKLTQEVEENTRGDATPKTTKMLLATETTGHEEYKDPKSGEMVRRIKSSVSEGENTEKLPEEDIFVSQKVTDNRTVVSTDVTSSSDEYDFLKSSKDVSEEDKKLVAELENLIQLTGCDTVKMDLIQSSQVSVWKDDSDVQNVSHHDDIASSRLTTVGVLEQEETVQVQNTEALSCDKDSLGQEVHALQTSDEKETVDYVKIEDGNTAVESSGDVQGSGQDEEGEKCEDPTNKEVNTQEPAADVSEESGISAAMDASNSQREQTHSDHSAKLQVNKQKKRKLGSTRRSQLSRKPEGDKDDTDDTKESEFSTETDVKSLDKTQVGEESPVTAEVPQFKHAPPLLGTVHIEQLETSEASTVHDEGLTLHNSTSDLLCTESNVIPGTDDLMVLLPEQCAPHSEEVVDPVTFVKVAHIKDGERDASVSVEPSQLDDFTGTEKQVTSAAAGRNRRSINQLLPPNTESDTNTGITEGSLVSVSETRQGTQNDEERPDGGKVKQDQDSDEGARNKNLEMKDASPDLNSSTRRRKLGSTRRNLGSRTKGDGLHQEVESEATEAATAVTAVRDVTTESVPKIPENELQLHTEHKEDEHTQEEVSETVEYSRVGESQLKPQAQQTVEESPVSQGPSVETEHPLTPPSASPKNDPMSASGRRRRKMGSHRKSRGPQTYEDQSASANGRGVSSITDEGATEVHSEESVSLDTISEVDEGDKKPPSNISTSKAGEHSRPESEKTPVQPRHAEIRLGQESQKPLSLAGNPREPGLRSNSYNVVMVGDSSVGKTSFMKRAQSGKFSLDLPASLGLDSCMWTVVVEGKPMVLQLWDTAGQERFRSITRQIFHKAQAFLLMYDISSSQSFSAVSYWASCIQEAAAENVPVLLLGNKSDHAQRQVKTQQGETLAQEYNFEFMECSAATGENVIQSLETVARMLSQRSDTREEATALHKEPEQKKSSRCC